MTLSYDGNVYCWGPGTRESIDKSGLRHCDGPRCAGTTGWRFAALIRGQHVTKLFHNLKLSVDRQPMFPSATLLRRH